MKSETKAVFPILGILGVVFITLKLLDKIDWSWWWVLAPFWGPPAFAIVVVAFFIVIVFIKAVRR